MATKKPDLLDSPFPPPHTASPEGVVAVGAAPHPELLKIAYQQGIFPWPHSGMPLLWFSPDPRFVIDPPHAHIPRSLRKRMRANAYRVTTDEAFADVMSGCASVPRPGQSGTWITSDMLAGYVALHEEGFAHSVEAWDDDGELVGGLYGVSFGRAFFGESMFAHAPDASKVAFGTLLGNLIDWGFTLVDCQTYTDHLARFGAIEIRRDDFLDDLAAALQAPTREGPWRLTLDPAGALARLQGAR
jgi:leucyl/phenylalanyl-tRNA--protein transferase